MNIYFLITIDTECDRLPGWRNRIPLEFESITLGISGKLQNIFTGAGIKPTYLLSPEVIEDLNSVRVLAALKDVELATHLHGELIDPGRKPMGEFTTDFQGMYTREIEYEKLKNLTELFTKTFGYPPTSFRAGRFGIGKNTLSILEELGYLVDSSIVPTMCWQEGDFTADFRNAPIIPYYPSYKDYTKPGTMRILEVPLTMRQPKLFLNNKKIPINLWKTLIRIPNFRPLWLRPSFFSFEQMRQVVDQHLQFCHNDENIFLNMMFHSVEVIANASPYAINECQVDDLLDRLNKIIDHIMHKGAQSVTLTETASTIKSTQQKYFS